MVKRAPEPQHVMLPKEMPGEFLLATALARALAADAPVLVLDDALSAVDTETEAAILRKWHEKEM